MSPQAACKRLCVPRSHACLQAECQKHQATVAITMQRLMSLRSHSSTMSLRSAPASSAEHGSLFPRVITALHDASSIIWGLLQQHDALKGPNLKIRAACIALQHLQPTRPPLTSSDDKLNILVPRGRPATHVGLIRELLTVAQEDLCHPARSSARLHRFELQL